MSRLFGIARAAAEYVRQRFEGQTRRADAAKAAATDRRTPPGGMQSTPGAPPVNPLGRQIEEQFDEVQLLGRDASYDQGDWDVVREKMVRVSSSNVWGYYFEREARTTGILYVTFLRSGSDGKKSTEPGPTYAYYTVPVRVYQRFKQEAAGSAGRAVWDNLRVRGTLWGHQFTYRLVHVSGEYIPRKAVRPTNRPLLPGETPSFRVRHLPAIGMGRRTFQRSTLTPEGFDNAEPDRGD
jgi:hypothetical protein